jgi:hypothetical protein
MTRDLQNELMEIEERAREVLLELLDSESPDIQIKAAKIYSSLSEVAGEEISFEELHRVKSDLLGSEDEKILLRAVEYILIKSKKKGARPETDIISPFETWYKGVYKNTDKERIRTRNQSRIKRYKFHWFKSTGYIPHRSQKMVHDSTKRFIVCISGRRFGKSLLAAKEAETMLMQPGKRIWVVAPTYSLTDKIFREIYDSLVRKKRVDPEMIIKKSENERLIRLAWGSEVVGKSSDNPDSLLGEAVDLLIFDECAKAYEQVWEKYLRPTLTDRKGRAIFITTPEGTNWVYDIYKRGKLTDKKCEWASFLFPTRDNPHISEEDIKEAKRTLKEEVFKQEYLANFFSFEGKVYKDFTIETHVMDLKQLFDTGE